MDGVGKDLDAGVVDRLLGHKLEAADDAFAAAAAALARSQDQGIGQQLLLRPASRPMTRQFSVSIAPANSDPGSQGRTPSMA